VWDGDQLIDYVGGNNRYQMDGTKQSGRIIYPYRFDAATTSQSGSFAAKYERLGTKAIVLGPNDLFREINRSYYHAHVYEYPILFFQMPDGREVLAHCPTSYCDLQIEDPTSGEILSEEGTGRVQSLFHSRLASNAAGNRLLSAGWVWHPFDVAYVFDLQESNNGKIQLLERKKPGLESIEISSSAFNSAGHLIASSGDDAEDFDDDEPGERVRPGMIGVFDLDSQQLISLTKAEDMVGTMMPVGTRYVVGLHDHPKLIDLSNGRVLCRWQDVKSGNHTSSIIWHKPLPPPMALDPKRGRLAIADDKNITVIELQPELLF
jgi:hypothetical protein